LAVVASALPPGSDWNDRPCDQALYNGQKPGPQLHLHLGHGGALNAGSANATNSPAIHPPPRERFLSQSCSRTLGPHQLQHLTAHCEQVSRIAATWRECCT